MKQKFIAYEGVKFSIEWYSDDRGKSEVLDYYADLPETRKDKILYLFRLIGDIGKIFNKEKFRYEGEQIYTFKPSSDRFLCFFFDGSKVIVTNAYEKKTSKMPRRELEKALKIKADYIHRTKKGKQSW